MVLYVYFCSCRLLGGATLATGAELGQHFGGVSGIVVTVARHSNWGCARVRGGVGGRMLGEEEPV